MRTDTFPLQKYVVKSGRFSEHVGSFVVRVALSGFS